MSLTRKFLSALNIDADKIDEIITAHSETVDALKKERDDYKAQAEANSEAKANAEKLQKQVEDLTEQVEKNGKDAYKVKYEAIKEEFADYKKAIESEKTKATKTEAYRALLKEIGISEKRIDAVLKVSNMEDIKLDKDGKIEGIEDLKKSLSEEWEDFIVKESKTGAKTETPPKGNGGKVLNKEEIMKIKDTEERQSALREYLLNKED